MHLHLHNGFDTAHLHCRQAKAYVARPRRHAFHYMDGTPPPRQIKAHFKFQRYAARRAG